MKKFAVPILFVFFILGSVFYFTPSIFFDGPFSADISLKPDDQERWREPDPDGYMPAPPHDETGHTWHHPDEYLFLMTKYGLEEIIGQEYPNNMPAYKDILTDEEILASLSFIKSTWSREIKLQHDKINEMNK